MPVQPPIRLSASSHDADGQDADAAPHRDTGKQSNAHVVLQWSDAAAWARPMSVV